ncbi:MAG: class I SAM-dependent methyltransferase [Pseudomonadota bacterium]
MFILFQDRDNLDVLQQQHASVVANLFNEVFSDVDMVTRATSLDALGAECQLELDDEDKLIVALGVQSLSETPAPTLPFLILGDSFSDRALEKFQVICSPNKTLYNTDPRPKAIRELDWPLWSQPYISKLRTIETGAFKARRQIPNTVLSTGTIGRHLHRANVMSAGQDGDVVFAASFDTSKDVQSVQQLIKDFFEVFKSNNRAHLRIHLFQASARNRSCSAVIKELRPIIRGSQRAKCRISLIDATHTRDQLEDYFFPASFFIIRPELDDDFTATGYLCSLTPMIVDGPAIRKFGISHEYPLITKEKVDFCDLLKNAFHIAATSPSGYHSLRKSAADSARERFSVAALSSVIRDILWEQPFLESVPRIDARRERERHLVHMVGLHDYKLSGWLDYEKASVCSGFAINESDTVVDVGCGTGGFSEFVAKFAGQLVYCDVNAHALAEATKKINAVARGDTKALQTTGEALEIEGNFADKVICTEVLEHVDNPNKVMGELFRIGKPGALYLISVPDTLNEVIQKPIAPTEYFEKPNHIRVFEREAFAELVRSSGFELVAHETMGFYSSMEWILKWFDDYQLDITWARLWKRLLDHGAHGLKTKKTLDTHFAKSQTILARKPQG